MSRPPAGKPRAVATPSAGDLERAWHRVRAHLRPTPLVRIPSLGARAFLKLETMQPSGSFKIRGAMLAVDAAPGDAPLVTGSAGNHGIALAYVANMLGRRAKVVVATTTSPAKIEALRRYPVEVLLYGESCLDAETRAMEFAAEGYHYISPYNDTSMIAGASTIVGEIADELDGPLTLVVPVGGGGLAAGVILAAQRQARKVNVVGVVAAASPTMSRALEAGEIVTVDCAESLADGIAGNIESGSATFGIIRDYGLALPPVSEVEIQAAMRFLMLSAGVVAEGAGAVATAAVLADPCLAEGTVVSLVTGRAITASRLAATLTGP